MGFVWTILTLVSIFLISCLARKFGSYSLLNGFMSKEKADAVFPEWRKQQKDDKNEKEQDTNK